MKPFFLTIILSFQLLAIQAMAEVICAYSNTGEYFCSEVKDIEKPVGPKPLTPNSPILARAPMVPLNANIQCLSKVGKIEYYLDIKGRTAILTESQSGVMGYDYVMEFRSENNAEGTNFQNEVASVWVYNTPAISNIMNPDIGKISLTFGVEYPGTSYKNILFGVDCIVSPTFFGPSK